MFAARKARSHKTDIFSPLQLFSLEMKTIYAFPQQQMRSHKTSIYSIARLSISRRKTI
ncbi:hypothetical protein IQ269_07270 [Tychonema sp. LEGE 07199]|uniref:hypothetical protein n=1 Tax=unclassified Tychonema TaxID=2642144 RepID=UPI00187F19FD|nr:MULTISPECIES: hypothetical protein [unclassified Tychonema]MBE9120621.1 hypothetical protein [Tychonema sp. LEGE 07199]MBE9131983.1 hypothetical protein [Tychonema sp. LEGE 07196]